MDAHACGGPGVPPETVADLEALIRRDEELARDGWVRRFVAAPPRLQEMASLYESLGYEVLQEPIAAAELPEACGGCVVALSLSRAVYTRKRP